MADKKISDEQSKEVLERLSRENAQWREKFEEAMVEIRLRAPNADGLSLKGAIKSILDERDSKIKKIDLFREEIKKLLKILISGNLEDAKKEINIFLFKNK